MSVTVKLKYNELLHIVIEATLHHIHPVINCARLVIIQLWENIVYLGPNANSFTSLVINIYISDSFREIKNVRNKRLLLGLNCENAGFYTVPVSRLVSTFIYFPCIHTMYNGQSLAISLSTKSMPALKKSRLNNFQS